MPKKPNNQAIINGGEEIEILLMSGESETVKVLLLPVSKYEDYLKLIDHEEQFAELVCGKEEGWAATVAPDSVLDIVDKGNDVNFTTVLRWANRRAQKQVDMLPLAEKGMKLRQALPTSVQMPPQ